MSDLELTSNFNHHLTTIVEKALAIFCNWNVSRKLSYYL